MNQSYCERFCFVFFSGKPSAWIALAKEWGIPMVGNIETSIVYLKTAQVMAEYAYNKDIENEVSGGN